MFISVIFSLRDSLSTDYYYTTTYFFFFFSVSPPGSLLSISLNVYIFTQKKNCGGELIAEIFVPLVCVRIKMVQKAKKK